MIEKEQILELFYWFHRHPELSYEEFGTTEKIREILNAGGSGSLAAASGDRPGRTGYG